MHLNFVTFFPNFYCHNFIPLVYFILFFLNIFYFILVYQLLFAKVSFEYES